VMMKVGTSTLAAEIARTHTGALVGDDRLVGAALRQWGIVRVQSLEELAVTAGLLARSGPLPPGGLGVVSISGGACDIIADRGEVLGLPLPELAAPTRSRLAELLPDYVTPRNPLDITGAASERPQLFAEALEAIAHDPSVALLAAVFVLPTTGRAARFAPRLELMGQGLRAAGERGFLVAPTAGDIDAATAAVLDQVGIPYAITRLGDAVAPFANAIRWSECLRKPRPAETAADELELLDRTGQWSEAQGLELLAEHGVPVVPWRRAATAEEAVAAARELGYPVAVKVLSPEILHKTDIGGVALGIGSDDEARKAFEQVAAAAGRIEGARLEGALVAAMRSGGVELIVGVVRDRDWGPTLAVGLGGVWVHVADDTTLRLLPVAADDVREMLGELRGKALLHGVRGSPPADLDRLVQAIIAFARLAERLGSRLASIEANPLRVDGPTVEALDAAVVWQ